MPKVQQKPTNFDERRFAALLAGFDIGNASEEEAVSKGRALRKMAENANMRIVDVMELPEVKKAIDDQMQPTRTESPALQEALELSAALQEELTERTRDVRRLAELLRREEETKQTVRQPYAGAQSVPAQRHARGPYTAMPWATSWEIQIGCALLVLVLLVVGFFAGNSKERGELNGLGNSEGTSAGVVRENGAVRPLPKHGALHHRVHRGGTSVGNR